MKQVGDWVAGCWTWTLAARLAQPYNVYWRIVLYLQRARGRLAHSAPAMLSHVPCRSLCAVPCGAAQEHGEFLYIAMFGTAPELQGQGVGSKLLREVLAYADERGL